MEPNSPSDRFSASAAIPGTTSALQSPVNKRQNSYSRSNVHKKTYLKKTAKVPKPIHGTGRHTRSSATKFARQSGQSSDDVLVQRDCTSEATSRSQKYDLLEIQSSIPSSSDSVRHIETRDGHLIAIAGSHERTTSGSNDAQHPQIFESVSWRHASQPVHMLYGSNVEGSMKEVSASEPSNRMPRWSHNVIVARTFRNQEEFVKSCNEGLSLMGRAPSKPGDQHPIKRTAADSIVVSDEQSDPGCNPTGIDNKKSKEKRFLTFDTPTSIDNNKSKGKRFPSMQRDSQIPTRMANLGRKLEVRSSEIACQSTQAAVAQAHEVFQSGIETPLQNNALEFRNRSRETGEAQTEEQLRQEARAGNTQALFDKFTTIRGFGTPLALNFVHSGDLVRSKHLAEEMEVSRRETGFSMDEENYLQSSACPEYNLHERLEETVNFLGQ